MTAGPDKDERVGPEGPDDRDSAIAPENPTGDPWWALRITLLYTAFAALWILLSDKLLGLWLDAPTQQVLASTVKGWVFVAVTAALLFALLRRGARRAAPVTRERPLWREIGLPVGLVGIVTLALVVGVAGYLYQGEAEQHRQRMSAVAELKAQQVEVWIDERLLSAGLHASSFPQAELYQRWKEDGDLDARDQLFLRLRQFADAGRFASVSLLGPDGQLLWSLDYQGHPVVFEDSVRQQVLALARSDSVGFVGPYLDAFGEAHLDFVATLPLETDEKPVVVLHTGIDDFLSPRLRDWPLPSRSGEIVLFRRDGSDIVFLTPLAGVSEEPLARRPADDQRLLAAQLIRGATDALEFVSGVDYRDVPVSGVGRAIAGTDWYLLAKVDSSEQIASSVRSLAWVVFAGALFFLAFSASLYLSRQRRRFAVADAVRHSQSERLRTLRLLEALLESSDDAIYAKDTQGRHLLCNRAAAGFIGRPVAAVLGENDYALFAAEDAERMTEIQRRVIEEERTITGEETLAMPDGSRIFLTTRSPLRDEHNRVIGVVGISRDVTERAREQEALRESAARLQTISDSLPQAYLYEYTYDIEDPRFLSLSANFESVHGLSVDEALRDGSRVLAQVEPGHRGLWQAKQQYSVERLIDFRGEVPFIRADGERRWLLVQSRPQPLDGGRVVWRGVAMDVTERKEAEQQARKLAQAVEQSVDSIVIANLDAEIEYVNAAFERVTGYTRDEVLGQNPSILHSGRTPEQTYEELWKSIPRGETWEGEFCNKRKDGSEYIEWAIIAPLRQPDGRITHYVAVKKDITEQKRVAEELERHREHLEELVEKRTAELRQARLEAEAANAAKSAFLANMSHEIRTPMNAIIGLTHLLRRDGVPPGQVERLDRIDNAGRHLLSIINDILDLSKIEAGRLQLEDTDFHLSAILDNVASIIRDPAREKGLKIEIDPDAVPVWLRGDPTRLRQALLNLAGNAVKFTDSGSIRLCADLLDVNGDDLHVRFTVMDTGVGIPGDQLPRLFRETFAQADPSIARTHGGTGLGLPIVNRLAEMMGGEVGAESTPGEGSTFWFTVHLRRGRGAVPHAPQHYWNEPEAELRERHAGARVLLAEDNIVNQEVAVELLHAVGLSVDVAVNGREAVRLASNRIYDVVLMDVQMPEMDGLEATRAIRKLPGWQSRPILALTANAFEEDRRTCAAAGMNDFVAKPTDPERLYRTLLRWLDRTSTVRAEPPSGGLADADSRASADASSETASGSATFGGSERAAGGPDNADVPGQTEELPDSGSGKPPPARSRPDGTESSGEQVRARVSDAVGLAPGESEREQDARTRPVLDTARGTAALAGNVEKYHALLREFIDRHGRDGSGIRDAWRQGAHREAERVAHALKGAAGSLGFDRLADVSERLHRKLRADDEAAIDNSDLDAIDTELSVAADAVARLDSAPRQDADTEGVDERSLRVWLDELERLLEQGDTDALSLFERNEAALRAELGADLGRLAQSIRSFRFPQALAILRELRCSPS